MIFQQLLMLFQLFHQVSIHRVLVLNSHLLLGNYLSERIGLMDEYGILLFIAVKCLRS